MMTTGAAWVPHSLGAETGSEFTAIGLAFPISVAENRQVGFKLALLLRP